MTRETDTIIPAVNADGDPITLVDEQIEEAFSNGDCWWLAQALATRYDGLTVHVLSLEDECDDEDRGAWVHAFVKDARSGMYVDILGAHTERDLLLDWDWCSDWDSITEVNADTLATWGTMTRRFEGVTLDHALPVLAAHGWQPPSARR